jgi:hypothetical protein
MIYISIYIERERERERKKGRALKPGNFKVIGADEII